MLNVGLLYINDNLYYVVSGEESALSGRGWMRAFRLGLTNDPEPIRPITE